MNHIRVLLLVAGLTPLVSIASFAKDLYVAQNTAGAGTGVDCADAFSATWFNSASNWAAGAGKISPGDTVHLCGTFTGSAGQTMLTVQASGSSGSPIIILFEPGAIMRSPRWPAGTYLDDGSSGGAIAIINKNYIIIDGGSNGIIANEDSNGNPTNGTGLAYANTSVGVYGKGSNIIIRNLTIRNIYVINGNDTSTPATDTADIHIDDPSTNITICNNSLKNAMQGIISFATGSGPQNNNCQSNTFAAGQNIFLNTLDDHGWQIDLNPSAASAPNIYANNIGGDVNWSMGPSATIWHTDGIINYSTANGVVATPYIYNNLFYGALSTTIAGDGSATGFIFCTYGYGYSNSGTACNIFNNVIIDTQGNGGSSGAAMWLGGDSGYVVGPHTIYNNTFINSRWNITGTNSAATSSWYTIKNNITSSNQTANQFLFDDGISSDSMLNINTNVYYGSSQASWYWGGTSSSFSAWKTACASGGGTGCDSSSVYGDPLLDANYKPTSTSNARGLGQNLTSLCTGQMAPLCYDKPPSVGYGGSLSGSNARPASGAWDAGAYQTSSNPPPLPPTGVQGTAH